jgi:hypothetical protein
MVSHPPQGPSASSLLADAGEGASVVLATVLTERWPLQGKIQGNARALGHGDFAEIKGDSLTECVEGL